jgi:hypothetical protein
VFYITAIWKVLKPLEADDAESVNTIAVHAPSIPSEADFVTVKQTKTTTILAPLGF